MFRLGKWAVVVTVAIWILGAQKARAGIGFQPVSPDELKMTSEPLAPGAPAIILYRQVDRDDNSYTSHEDNYFRIKILTEEGRKHADIEIPFFKGNEDVVNVRGRTIRPDGSIVDFEGKVFEKQLVKGKFEGTGAKILAKTFTLPDVHVGGIIEYFYTVDLKEHYIFDSHWILSDELFTKKACFSTIGCSQKMDSSAKQRPGCYSPKRPSHPAIPIPTSPIFAPRSPPTRRASTRSAR